MSTVDQSTSNPLLHMHHIFRAHQELLDDAVRNRALYSALRRRIRVDSTVLDIESGTGIWAIAAAKLGAKRVVAIERDELLAGLIRKLVRENQVDNRVEVVRGDSREIRLGRDFDVIISETIGNLGFDEQIVPILIDARKRFLKRGGVLIPHYVRSDGGCSASAQSKSESSGWRAARVQLFRRSEPEYPDRAKAEIGIEARFRGKEIDSG